MDLTSMLREGSLTNLTEWSNDGLVRPGEITFDPEQYGSKNPNNVKSEAQEQWAYGDISPIFEGDQAGMVDRNLPDDATADAGPVVLFARHLMNQGADAATVDRELKTHFAKEQVRSAATELRELFKMDGIIGRIAVDAHGYDDCQAALAATEHSPYKRFIKFVIGCSCGDACMIPVADQDLDMVASTGNPADDFFADDTAHGVKEVPHCPSTRLPLYAAIDDVDPSWVEDLLVIVDNITGNPGDKSDGKPVEKAQAAFRAIDRAAAEQDRVRYSEPVDSSEYAIEAAENEVELAAKPLPPLDVDASAGDFIGEDAPSPLADEPSIDMTADTKGTIFEGSDVIELDQNREPKESVDVELNESEISW